MNTQICENTLEIIKVDKYKESRVRWQKENKEKMAEYARNYYRKRTDTDPEYKKKLCEKAKNNKIKAGTTKSKKVGRPRIISSDSYGNKI
jgi:hypothetical protein